MLVTNVRFIAISLWSVLKSIELPVVQGN